MRILFLIDSLNSGGAQRRVVNLITLLKKRGFDISLLVYRNDSFFADELHSAGVQEELIEAPSYASRLVRVRRRIKSINPDVLISFMETPNFIACFASMGNHTWKLVVNESSAKESSLTSRRGRLFKWFERYADAIVCNSAHAAELRNLYYPQYKSKTRVIYNPIILPQSYAPRSTSNESDPIKLVVAASYQYLKNPVALVTAYTLLDESSQHSLTIDWYGRIEVVPGDTRAYDEAQGIVERFGLGHKVRLHDATKSMHFVMESADVVGLFSEVEGLPNAICEGMYLAKPVVMTKVSDYDVLVDESNGFLCSDTSARCIAETLDKVARTPRAKLTSMGLLSAAKAHDLFLPETITDQWLDVLRAGTSAHSAFERDESI